MINKKPKIIQTDNGLEFKNKILETYLKNEGIKHVLSRSHHPQTNGCLERYHRELQKHMKYYLDKFDNFDDNKIELSLEYNIIFHNQIKKYSTKFAPYQIRDIYDQNLIDILLKNMLKNIKKHSIKENEILYMNEKLLLWNNLIKRNKYFRKK